MAGLWLHQTLRQNFDKLPSSARIDFEERILSGVRKGHWHIAMGEELEKLCQPGSGVHFLPSGYVLKPASSGSSTRVRLVLDPSLVYIQQLLPPVNIENSISSVLRNLRSTRHKGGIFLPQTLGESGETPSLPHGL